MSGIGIYIFDVDGTLTPSRGKMNHIFRDNFIDFCIDKEVYLVTGSDRPKTEEQITRSVYYAVTGVYNCAGNEYYEKGQLIYSYDFDITKEQEEFLQKYLKDSPFHIRTGNHIERRKGLVNFSIVGRNANPNERKQYILYDDVTKEREKIVSIFNKTFPDTEASVAGETGIDIYEYGRDKSQIMKDKFGQITFFGDKTEKGGNDYTIAEEVRNKGGTVHSVKTWEDTQRILFSRNA